MRRRVVIPVFLIIWLIIGVVAAAQRGYFTGDADCNTVGSTLVTILAGPLNYIGVDPEVNCPEAPEPSDN